MAQRASGIQYVSIVEPDCGHKTTRRQLLLCEPLYSDPLSSVMLEKKKQMIEIVHAEPQQTCFVARAFCSPRSAHRLTTCSARGRKAPPSRVLLRTYQGAEISIIKSIREKKRKEKRKRRKQRLQQYVGLDTTFVFFWWRLVERACQASGIEATDYCS